MTLEEWLHKEKLSATAFDSEELLESFLKEMTAGLTGTASSLPMIPSYIHPIHHIPPNKPVAVIDAGGTNLRTCLVEFDKDALPTLSHFNKQPMPGSLEEISADAFFNILADALEPMKNDFEQLGFCFSYTAEILPDQDARLLHWTKEIKMPELVGNRVGNGLQNALQQRGIHGKEIIILNDTVATLLSAIAEDGDNPASSHIGIILGTGTNSAYIEQNKNIGKINVTLKHATQVINVESGNFSRLDRGRIDRIFDAESEEPGQGVFEKMMSGAYLGDLTLLALKQAKENGYLSASASAMIAATTSLSIMHIDNFTADNGRDIGILESPLLTEKDQAIIRTVFNALVGRAAMFTAVNIAATAIKSGEGHNACRPICINIDGSTYHMTYRLAERTQDHLQHLLETRSIHVRCVHSNNAPIIGAAIAAYQ